MTGRAEVARLEKQLDAAFQRIKSLGPAADIEVQSDFARYLCVLVSGYLEKSVAELMLEHARNNGAATLQRFVDYRTRQFANPNSQRLPALVGRLPPPSRPGPQGFFVDER